MPNVRLRFLDGEVIEGETDDLAPERLGFNVRPAKGNNRMAWVPFSALKYCQIMIGSRPGPADPRGTTGLQKLVLRFNDGDVVRAYKDEVFSHAGNCLHAMIWDEEARGLIRLVVPYSSLKAVFYVDQWDSREPADRGRSA